MVPLLTDRARDPGCSYGISHHLYFLPCPLCLLQRKLPDLLSYLFGVFSCTLPSFELFREILQCSLSLLSTHTRTHAHNGPTEVCTIPTKKWKRVPAHARHVKRATTPVGLRNDGCSLAFKQIRVLYVSDSLKKK